MTDPINPDIPEDPFTHQDTSRHVELDPVDAAPQEDRKTSVEQIAQTAKPQEPLADLEIEKADTPSAQAEKEPQAEPQATQPTEDDFETEPTSDGERRKILAQTTNSGIDVFTHHIEEESELVDTPDGPNESVTARLDYEWTTPPVSPREYHSSKKQLHEGVFLHSERSEDADKRIRAYIPGDVFSSEDGVFFNEILNGANSSTVYTNNQFDKAVLREDSSWRQLVEVENGRIGMSRPKMGERGIEPATGERAMRRIKSLLGMGGLICVPLWHSGFWVTLKAPGDNALIELHRRMTEDKIRHGRDTLGLVFSNEQSYQVSWLYEFIMDHIHESSASFEGNRELMKEQIMAPDLNILLWGIASLAWPSGFKYYRSLTTKDGIKDLKTVAGNLDIIKLLWTDTNLLTKEQKHHMSRRDRGCHKPEAIEKYREHFNLYAGRSININDSVSLTLGMPSVATQATQGMDWISSLNRMINATFTEADPDVEERYKLIEMHTKATRMRIYSPWIKSVVADGVTYENYDEIAGTLDALTSMDHDGSFIELVKNEVKKYVDDTCVSLVAVPETSGEDTGIPRFQNLIPINVINTFFTLLVQRVQRIALS